MTQHSRPLSLGERAGVRVQRPALALLTLNLLLPAIAHAKPQQWAVLTGLVGHTKAEVIQRLGPPGDRSITVGGERLFYDRIDAGRFGAQAGQGARDNSSNTGLSLRDYDFRCHTEVVIHDNVMTAFNQTGNDCR